MNEARNKMQVHVEKVRLKESLLQGKSNDKKESSKSVQKNKKDKKGGGKGEDQDEKKSENSDSDTNSLKQFNELQLCPEESKMKLSQIGIGLVNFNLKCYHGLFCHETINLSHCPDGQIVGGLDSDPEEKDNDKNEDDKKLEPDGEENQTPDKSTPQDDNEEPPKPESVKQAAESSKKKEKSDQSLNSKASKKVSERSASDGELLVADSEDS